MSGAQDNIGGFLWRELTPESIAAMTPAEAGNRANALYAGGISSGSRGDPQLVRTIAALRARAEQAE